MSTVAIFLLDYLVVEVVDHLLNGGCINFDSENGPGGGGPGENGSAGSIPTAGSHGVAGTGGGGGGGGLLKTTSRNVWWFRNCPCQNAKLTND